jgi:hypothetical protein
MRQGKEKHPELKHKKLHKEDADKKLKELMEKFKKEQ